MPVWRLNVWIWKINSNVVLVQLNMKLMKWCCPRPRDLEVDSHVTVYTQ
jgi:hypothetical protein